MPIVHWLPKNGIRQNALRLFTSIGIEPKWPETGTLSLKEKASVYYSYSRDKTFYRPPREILDLCRQHGFTGQLVASHHPRIQGHAVLRKLTKGAAGNQINRIVSEFKTMELFVEKRSASLPH